MPSVETRRDQQQVLSNEASVRVVPGTLLSSSDVKEEPKKTRGNRIKLSFIRIHSSNKNFNFNVQFLTSAHIHLK